MSSPVVNTPIDPRTCERARLSRDPRFDGLFFTAVRSTGIYCRPVCPAPAPKRENVDYYPSAAAAETAGFRPCLRCRPELSPDDDGWRRGDAIVARTLKLIDQGVLAEHGVAELATRVHLGERQLRRLFLQHLGATPHRVHATRRLLFAKQLLTETRMPVTEVALAAGFHSLRRFHSTFREGYRMAPRDLRRGQGRAGDKALVLRLEYRPPFAFHASLEFLRSRVIPGIERVGPRDYARLLDPRDAAAERAWFLLEPWPQRQHALKLTLHGVAPGNIFAVVRRVRRMFDLDADPRAIKAVLGAHPLLRDSLRRSPGLRLPGSWDGFETAVRAVLGQQVSVAAARTLATRLLERHGRLLQQPAPNGLDRYFPDPETLAEADLHGIGLTHARADTVRAVADAVVNGRLDFNQATTLDDFVADCTALPGIGDWTAHYLAMRALGHPDAFPAGDLVLRRVAADDARPLSARTLEDLADAWRPWRAYAAIHLWRRAATGSAPSSRASTRR